MTTNDEQKVKTIDVVGLLPYGAIDKGPRTSARGRGMGRRARHPARWVAAGLLVAALVLTGCEVNGTASVDPAAVSALKASAASASALEEVTTPSSATISSAADGATTTAAEGDDSRIVPGTASTRTDGGKSVIIASDSYSTSSLIATAWSQALIANGFQVYVQVIDDQADQLTALKSGNVDVVVGYNSSLLEQYSEDSTAVTRDDVDQALPTALPSGLSVLNSAPEDDTAELATSAADAAKYHLTSIADLASQASTLTVALPSNAEEASSLTSALSDYYGITLKKTISTDFGGPKTLAALQTGTAAVGMVSNSQYQIDSDKLVVLKDPRHLFEAENPIPVIRTSTLSGLAGDTLNAVSAKFTTEVARTMKAQEYNNGSTDSDVVSAWLTAQGLN